MSGEDVLSSLLTTHKIADGKMAETGAKDGFWRNETEEKRWFLGMICA